MDLNLKNDIVFKAFFSRKGNEEFLKDFLESLLNIKIKDLKIEEEINLEKLFKEEKGGRIDLLATLKEGITVDIEMQVRKDKSYLERTPMYAAKLMSRQIGKGLNYKDINKTILINILDYNLLETEEYLSETVIVLDKHRDYEVIKNPKWYFIELPKFRKKKADINNKLEQWLLFIDDYDRGMIKMAEEKNKTIKKARGEMNYLTGDAEIKRLTELRERWEFDRNWDMEISKEEVKKEIAKEMLKNGENIEKIIKYTGLTKEEILNLKNITNI